MKRRARRHCMRSRIKEDQCHRSYARQLVAGRNERNQGDIPRSLKQSQKKNNNPSFKIHGRLGGGYSEIGRKRIARARNSPHKGLKSVANKGEVYSGLRVICAAVSFISEVRGRTPGLTQA